MTKYMISAVVALFAVAAYAQKDSAEELVAGKRQADMTYRQLMEIMGKASSMIQEGIIRENKQMVKEGANVILRHPAPNHKPWTIMDEADQKGFKQSLLLFDESLSANANKVVEEAGSGDWTKANDVLHELNASCISCHTMWRQKVRR